MIKPRWDDQCRVAKRVWQCLRWWEEVFVSSDVLIDFVWGDQENGGPENARICLAHSVIKLRKRIKPLGYIIVKHYRMGYALVAVDRVYDVFPGFVPATNSLGSLERTLKLLPPTHKVTGISGPTWGRYLTKESRDGFTGTEFRNRRWKTGPKTPQSAQPHQRRRIVGPPV